MIYILNNICGELGVAWTLLGYVIWGIQVVTPILLIISGMITMIQAMTAEKGDGLTKAQNELIKKIISAVAVFLVIWGTKLVVNLIANDSWQGCAHCAFEPFSGEGCGLITDN